VLFNSTGFLLFFVVVSSVHALLRSRPGARKGLLLGASYFFYGAWNPPFVGLLLFSTGLDFAAARAIAGSERPQARRAWLAASAVGNLGVLAFFKYGDFLAESLWGLVPEGVPYPDFLARIVLPVGISFYTFQSLGYTIDVYRGRRDPARHLADFALYVAFFPQLVAGPIVRATELLPQIESPRFPTGGDLHAGLHQAARGFAKKVLVADGLAVYVDAVYAAPAAYGALDHWLALYAFAFQIYCDFSGYSDIAIGCARMLGYEVPPNFRLPYLACGPADFWRRWHISLSTWLRDYLYIPLGGSRGSAGGTYANLAVTMLLGGLWHGAAWGFVLWGAYHGAWLALHRALCRDRGWLRMPRALSRVLTFHGVCLGWVFFRAETWERSQMVLRGLVDFGTPAHQLPGLVGPWLAVAAVSHLLGASGWWRRRWVSAGPDLHGVAAAALLLLAFACATESPAFLYFQF